MFEPKAKWIDPFGLGDPSAEAQRRSRPRGARREAVALTAKRSEGLGGLGGLPPIGVKKGVSAANSFWGVRGKGCEKSYPQDGLARELQGF